MNQSFTVRNVTREDYPRWLTLWTSYNEFYERVGQKALPEEITLSTWQRFFDLNEPVHALVCERDNKVVGLAHFIFHRSTSMIHNTCYLQDLFTAADCRGQGIATALIKAVYERAKTKNAPRVYWQTHETNKTAMRLYDKLAERTGFLVYRKVLT